VYFNGIHIATRVLRSCMLLLKYLNNKVITAKLWHRYTEEGDYTPWLSNEGSFWKSQNYGLTNRFNLYL